MRKKMIKVFFLFINLIFILILSSCKSTTGTSTSKGEKTKLPNKRRFDSYKVIGIVPGIKKFVVKYNDELYRGGKPYSEEGFKKLKEMGIKTIISVTPDDMEREFAKKYNMELIEIPFEKNTVLSKELKKRFINLFFQYKAPFYLHGDESISRAGILGALYRMKVCDRPFGKTMMEFQQLGGDMKKNRILIDSIRN